MGSGENSVDELAAKYFNKSHYFLRRSRGMNMKWNESDWDLCFTMYVSLFLSKSYNASERAISYIPTTNDLAESGVFDQIK